MGGCTEDWGAEERKRGKGRWAEEERGQGGKGRQAEGQGAKEKGRESNRRTGPGKEGQGAGQSDGKRMKMMTSWPER